jgi:multisubunit Na+/H+ antiporter MnhG subunit
MQDIWRKLNANERMASYGAIAVIVGWLLFAVSAFGFGAGTITLLGAIALLVVYYLKYAPSQASMTWPMPVATIALIVSAIVALLALLGLLGGLGLGLFFYGGLYLVAELIMAVGGVLMVLYTWREYQLAPKAPAPPPPPPAV